jgi:putative OmpL-like beta-barrel porin-2
MRVANRLVTRSVFGLMVCALSYCLPSYGADVTASPTPDGKEAKKVVEPPKPPEPRFKLYGWIEAGITGNPNSPIDNHNFGHLFTDRANEPLLNQVSIVAERALDPKVTGFDWGFKFWFMEGSDARYTKAEGPLDLATNDRIQADFPEVSASFHLPILSAGGLDVKLGKYQDLSSAETTDPRTNVFYSKSYIYNFGIPISHLGGLAIWHATPLVDLYFGLDRGLNMVGDNNTSIALEAGFGLNLLDGNLTVLALTHIGPENPHDNHDYRFENDITTTWKINKCLTSITDMNLIYDQLLPAWGGGVAQYFTYAVNDWLQLGVRGEIWRDEKGFYVAQFRANNDFMHVLRGDAFAPDPSTFSGGPTTYLEVTGGITIKPPMPKPIAGLMIRPEVRYDRALTDHTSPFNQLTDRDQWTFGVDVVLQF